MEGIETLETKLPRSGVKFKGKFIVTCRDPDGNIKWIEEADNLVVDEGINHILDVLFTGTGESQVDPWYVGLTGGTPSPAAGDTLASHGGWTEFTDYSEANRQTFTDARTNQQVDNNGNEAQFSINQDTSTIGGAFLASVNSGTAGILLCVVAFTGGDKAADNGDTLSVEYQFTGADDGA